MEDIIPGEDWDTNRIATLLEKIAENPYDYDSHIAYVSLLRKFEDTEELRSAREVFHSIFPFSEGFLLCFLWLTLHTELWIQWLDDEEKAAGDGEGVLSVYELYDRAASDYLCMPLSSN